MTKVYIALNEETYHIKEDTLTEREILKVTSNLDQAVLALVDEYNHGSFHLISIRQMEYNGKKEYTVGSNGRVTILNCGNPLIELPDNLIIKRYEV